jgi:hypothetical protein
LLAMWDPLGPVVRGFEHGDAGAQKGPAGHARCPFPHKRAESRGPLCPGSQLKEEKKTAADLT